MIKLSYDMMISRIKEKSGLSSIEIEDRIKKKLSALSGLISKEGAAHIVANELGIMLFEKTSGRFNIKDIPAGVRELETVGRVKDIYEIREFKKETSTGRVGSFLLSDGESSIRVTLWNDQVKNLEKLKKNDLVKITNAYSKDNNGRVEIQINDKSKIEVNPSDESMPALTNTESSAPLTIRRKINELVEGEENVELLGTVVQVFGIKYFEVCSKCQKRVKPDTQGQYICEADGKVEPAYSYMINLFLDDGSENMRVVMFRNQVQRLLEKSDEDIQKMRTDDAAQEKIKYDMLGQIIKLNGRVVKNAMFDRIEFNARYVDPRPNPEEELKQMREENKEVNAPSTPTVHSAPSAPSAPTKPKQERSEPKKKVEQVISSDELEEESTFHKQSFSEESVEDYGGKGGHGDDGGDNF